LEREGKVLSSAAQDENNTSNVVLVGHPLSLTLLADPLRVADTRNGIFTTGAK
jgi:hypothetical protein